MLLNLNLLSIDMNKLKSLNSDLFKFNPSLYQVSFSSNLLRELPENLFSSQLDIDSIYFDQNLLSSSRTFGVSFVDLSDNRLERLVIDSGTKILHIKNNFIPSADCPGNNLTSYERVFASNNSLVNLKCFREMENLYDLDVSDNNLQRPSHEVFSKLSKMRDIRIFNQKFSKIPAKVFTSMKDVQYFRIDRFTDYRNLRQLFPKITMVSLTTKTWNCSYTTQVSKVLARQRIRMNYNDYRDRLICNVT